MPIPSRYIDDYTLLGKLNETPFGTNLLVRPLPTSNIEAQPVPPTSQEPLSLSETSSTGEEHEQTLDSTSTPEELPQEEREEEHTPPSQEEAHDEEDAADVKGAHLPELLVLTPLEVQATDLSRQQIRQELEALTRLKHPNILSPLQLLQRENEHEGQPQRFILLRPYVEGTTMTRAVMLSTPFQEHAEEGVLSLEPHDSSTTSLIQLLGEAQHRDEHLQRLSEDTDEVSLIISEVSRSSRQRGLTNLDTRLERLKHLLTMLLDGLDYLHRYKRFHGALCAENVFVSASQHLCIAEAGLWSILHEADPEERDTSDQETDQDAPAAVMGSSRGSLQQVELYRAPELFEGEPPNAASDLYSVGCLLFHALCGEPPFEPGEQPIALHHLESRPPSVLEHQPHCPFEWVHMIEALLRKDPLERPSLEGLRLRLETLPSQSSPFSSPFPVEPTSYCGRPIILNALLGHASSPPETMLPITLIGDIAQGKHYFVDHLAYELSRQGWFIVRGRCYAQAHDPYQGWRLLINDLRQILLQAPEWIEQEIGEELLTAATLFPRLSPGTEHVFDEETEVKNEIQKLEATQALREVLDFISHQRPLLMVFDDLHLATRDTRELLHDILAVDGHFRGMLLVTTSPKFPEPLLEREQHLPHYVIEPLIEEEALHLLHKLGTPSITARLEPMLERMQVLAPQIIKECVHELQHTPEERRDRRAEELLALSVRFNKKDSPRPADFLKALLQERIEALEDEVAMHILQTLAIHAGTMSLGLLQNALQLLTGKPPSLAERDKALKLLTTQRLLKRISMPYQSMSAYRIASETCRTITIEHMDSETLMLTHSALGKALNQLPNPDLIQIFEHARRARRFSEAKRVAELARQRACNILAFSQAAEIQSWVVSQRDEQKKESSRQELAELEAASGQHQEAAQLWEHISEEQKHDAARLLAMCEASEAWFYAGKLDLAGGLQARALQDAFQQSYQPLQRPYHTNALKQYWSTWFDRAPDLSHEDLSSWNSVERAEHSKTDASLLEGATMLDARLRLYTLILQSATWLNTGHAPTFNRRLRRLARQERRPEPLANAYLYHAHLMIELDFHRAKSLAGAYLEQALVLFAHLGLAIKQAEVNVFQAYLAQCCGHWSKASALYSSAEERWRSTSSTTRMVRVEIDYRRGLFALHQGKLEDAQRLEESLFYEERHLGPAQIRGHQLATQRALLSGQLQDAALHLERVQQALPRETQSLLHVWYAEHMASYHIMHGEPEVAVGQLDLLWEKKGNLALYRAPRVKARLELKLAQSLCAQLTRNFYMDRGQRGALLQRVQGLTRRIRSKIEHLTTPEIAALERLHLRALSLAGKSRKALHQLERAEQAFDTVLGDFARLTMGDIRGHLLLDLDQSTEGLGTLTQVKQRYQSLGLWEPLISEGWPASPEHTELKPDTPPIS